MTNQKSVSVGNGGGTTSVRVSGRGSILPRAVGTASLVAAGGCAFWLRVGSGLPAVSPVRCFCLLIVCAYLISATWLLLEERA
jgi:hypothetical protein